MEQDLSIDAGLPFGRTPTPTGFDPRTASGEAMSSVGALSTVRGRSVSPDFTATSASTTQAVFGSVASPSNALRGLASPSARASTAAPSVFFPSIPSGGFSSPSMQRPPSFTSVSSGPMPIPSARRLDVSVSGHESGVDQPSPLSPIGSPLSPHNFSMSRRAYAMSRGRAPSMEQLERQRDDAKKAVADETERFLNGESNSRKLTAAAQMVEHTKQRIISRTARASIIGARVEYTGSMVDPTQCTPRSSAAGSPPFFSQQSAFSPPPLSLTPSQSSPFQASQSFFQSPSLPPSSPRSRVTSLSIESDSGMSGFRRERSTSMSMEVDQIGQIESSSSSSSSSQQPPQPAPFSPRSFALPPSQASPSLAPLQSPSLPVSSPRSRVAPPADQAPLLQVSSPRSHVAPSADQAPSLPVFSPRSHVAPSADTNSSEPCINLERRTTTARNWGMEEEEATPKVKDDKGHPEPEG